MIKLVAFDWNGTLLADTKPVILAEELALKDLGLSQKISLAKFQGTYDIPIYKFWENLGLDPKFFKANDKKIQRLFVKHYEPLEKKARLRKWAIDTLRSLHRKKITNVIYSNHPSPHIEAKLKIFKINTLISEVIGRASHDEFTHLHNRSKDQKLQTYVLSKKLKPKEVLTIGDTEEEIEIGKKFGYFTVGITGGWNSVKRIRKHAPDFIIRSLKELLPIIKKLNEKR